MCASVIGTDDDAPADDAELAVPVPCCGVSVGSAVDVTVDVLGADEPCPADSFAELPAVAAAVRVTVTVEPDAVALAASLLPDDPLQAATAAHGTTMSAAVRERTLIPLTMVVPSSPDDSLILNHHHAR